MLSRSISSVLKGKGREGLVCSNSSNLLASLQAASGTSTSTPSRSIHAGPSRALSSGAAYARSTKRLSLACTCRPSARDGIWKTSSSSAFVVQKAQLHASALRKQEARIPEIAELSIREYHEIADETMDRLTETLEAIQEELADDEFDIEYSSGVLTVKLPADKGTYVINKQPPNKQIWLSSPLSGPKRYDYSREDEHWFYTRDGSFMISLLEEELSDKLGRKVTFDALHQ